VPLLLVYLALWAGGLSARRSQQPPLALDRASCLGGRPALLAASPAARASGSFAQLLASYPAAGLEDTGQQQLWSGTGGPPLQATLEGLLLGSWFRGRQAYDALYLPALPEPRELAAGAAQLQYTLLFNQSAVAGIPAALSSANSALLRLLLAATDASLASASEPSLQAASDPLPVLPSEPEVGQGGGKGEGGGGGGSGGRPPPPVHCAGPLGAAALAPWCRVARGSTGRASSALPVPSAPSLPCQALF
jgi:hypothetical protein